MWKLAVVHNSLPASVVLVAAVCCVAALLLAVPPIWAQEARWKELNAQVVQLYQQGKFAEAIPLAQESIRVAVTTFGEQHPNVATSLDNLAGLFYAWAQPAQAAPFFDRAFETLAKQFEYYFTYMSEKERLAFLATVQDRFSAYFSFCFTYCQQFPGLSGKIYDVVLWEKGFIAQSAVALRTKIQSSGDAEALRLLDELTARKTQLATLAIAPPETDSQKQAARPKQIEQLENETNDIEKELVKRSGALAEEKKLARVTWQQVRGALKKDEAAVEFVRFPFHDGKKWTGTSYYVALVVTPEGKLPTLVVLGEAKNLEAVPLEDYRALVRVPDPEATVRSDLGRKFVEAFWQPLEAALGGAKRVYVSPDGVLNQVSLGVVPRGDGKLLMDAYDLHTLTSTKDLLREQHPTATNSAVLIGNPQFDLSEAEQRAAVGSLQTNVETASEAAAFNGSGRGMRSRDLRGGALNPLPGTQAEVQAVSSLLKGQWTVQTYTQQNAVEERVKRVNRPRVLHLATHGFFVPDQPRKLSDFARLGENERPSGLEDPMLRSGLFLAGANRALEGGKSAPDLDDGILTAYEATQLNLQGTELVVLSACETGLGQVRNGEGVFGLRRALQEAGAEAVLMSLWSVPDKETKELMTLFYEKWLSGKEKHQALREAQLEMRGIVKKRYGKDLPYYWGAFILVGR